MGETLTNVNPLETAKIKTHHARIVVDGTAEKPYYSIEWYDHAKNEYFLGYSSYYIGHVFKWLEECFEIIEASKTNAEKIRVMSDEELAAMLKDYKDCNKNCIISNGKNCYQICEEESTLLKWLQQPAEVDE